MYPDAVSFRIRNLPLSSAIKELALLVAVARTNEGSIIVDGSDFRVWLEEIAENVAADPVEVSFKSNKIL